MLTELAIATLVVIATAAVLDIIRKPETIVAVEPAWLPWVHVDPQETGEVIAFFPGREDYAAIIYWNGSEWCYRNSDRPLRWRQPQWYITLPEA